MDVPAFFAPRVRAQITALACTLPKESGKPLSRWSGAELARAAQEQGLTPAISRSTIQGWLQEDKIKPWQFHSWQKSTDPRFLEKATEVLDLYEHAQALVRRGQIVVCVDEKTCLQAKEARGGIRPARPGKPVRVGARYRRKGTFQLFAGLLVHRGETLVRYFERKRFLDFQRFLLTVLGSLWTNRIQVCHLILDNGPTHAPKQLKPWITTQDFPFDVQVHWLPINASWLDQIEIIFSPLKTKVLTPMHAQSPQEVKDRINDYFHRRNQHPTPVRWSYTSAMLNRHFANHEQRHIDT